MADSRRKISEAKGRHAENIASWWLRLNGYRILARRVRNPRGEIDIIARQFGTIVFVEVKSRSNARDLDHAISAYHMRRVVAAAEVEAHKYLRAHDIMRFDVILLSPWKLPRHLKNVYHQG